VRLGRDEFAHFSHETTIDGEDNDALIVQRISVALAANLLKDENAVIHRGDRQRPRFERPLDSLKIAVV
jgi:hypothetical protein